MTVTGELIPYFEPGTRPTGYCTAVVRVGRIVSCADSPAGGMAGTENIQIKECDGTDENPIGVACQGGSAIGDQVSMLGLKSNAVVPLIAGAVDITAGDIVVCDAEGRVTPYAAPALSGNAEDLPFIPGRVGTAVEDQATTDAEVGVWLN